VLLKRHRLPKTNGHIIGVLWGGNTDDMRWQRYSVEQLLTGLESVCRTHGSQLMMTTSRRTSADVEELCAQRLHTQVWCPLLVLANRANAHGTVEGILGAARVVVVSGESSSMIAEAVASGRPVVVVTPEPRERRTLAPKRQALLDTLADTPQVIVTTPQGCADAVRAVWDHANVPATTEWQKLCNAVTRLR
jgi:mitochondrial fission protein ELM1